MQFPFFYKKKNKKGLIGIDFGSNRVAIAHIMHADKTVNKPKLKQCAFEVLASNPAEGSLSKPAEGSIEAQSLALFKVAETFPVSQFFCNTAIENSAYELLLIDAPNVESSELKQAVRWRIKDQLPYHIDDAVLDVFEIPDQRTGRAQLMYVVASPQQKIETRVEQLKASNLDILAIDIYELAQRNIASILPEDKDGIIMIRLSDDSGLLTITRNATLFLTRKIDFGVNRLTRILDSGLDLKDKDSHELYETSLEPASGGELDAASSTVDLNQAELSEQGKLIIDEVVLEIQRSLDYYISHFNQRPVRKIIFAPVVNDVPGVIEYISEMLGITVEILDFNQCLNVAKPLSRELQAYCFDAIGLALRYEAEQGASG